MLRARASSGWDFVSQVPGGTGKHWFSVCILRLGLSRTQCNEGFCFLVFCFGSSVCHCSLESCEGALDNTSLDNTIILQARVQHPSGFAITHLPDGRQQDNRASVNTSINKIAIKYQ